MTDMRVTVTWRQTLYQPSPDIRVTTVWRQVLMSNAEAAAPEDGYLVLPDPPTVLPTTQEPPVFKPLVRRSDMTKVINGFASYLQAYLVGVADEVGGQTLRQTPIDANDHRVQVGQTSALPYSACTLQFLDTVLS